MGDIVIAAYRAKPGCDAGLLALVMEHVPYLRSLGLVTDRPTYAMRAQNGTILEVLEWQDGAIAHAHEMPEIHELWEKFGAVCDYIPLRSLAEASNLFAQFTPLDL
jgi:hypothetical protein